MSNFKVGDRIVVKEWNDMVEEFGVNKGYINCKFGFVPVMKHFCGESGTIIGFDDKGFGVNIDFDNDTLEEYYAISTDMVKHTTKDQKTFTMDMFKTGMRVETREGELYLVLKDCDTMYGDGHIVFANFDQNGFLCEEDYDDDLLEQSGMEEYDIVKVYAIDKEKIVFGTVLDPNKKYLIWERSEVDDLDDECEGCDFKVDGRCTIEDDEEDIETDLMLDILGLGKMFGFFDDDDDDELDDEEDGTMLLDDFLDMLLEMKDNCKEKDEPNEKIDHEEILKEMLWLMFLDFMDEEGNEIIK